MSMNLIFDVKGGSGSVDFPFQTPTELTYEILNIKNNQERVNLIEKRLNEWGWHKDDVIRIIEEIKDLLSNEHLELSME